jgi:allophanate hydrolase subunit 2
MKMSELVILFNPKNDGEEVLPQLDEFTENLKDEWSMIVCSQMTWYRIEAELQPPMAARYETEKIKPYERQNIKEDKAKIGFASIPYKGKPVVAIDGVNVVSARVGGMND